MILVVLGTQDKSFKRLIGAVEEQILKGNIKEKVIVQAGYTKYESSHMEIFDLVTPKELDQLMKKARLIITHGGVGSILGALQYEKTVIAAARLSKYGEHTNDHQLQIVEEFEKKKYLLALYDFNHLDDLLQESKKFKPKKYQSNNQKFVQLIESYIVDGNHISWWNQGKRIILSVFFILFLLVFILVML